MHGCGNDYIYIDCRNQTVKNPKESAIRLSNRHIGIGSDGLVLILPSSVADAQMRMFNADGSEGNMCGNAIRCVAKLLDKDKCTIETKSGIKKVVRVDTDMFQVDMGKAKIISDKEICMGNPHYVKFHDDIDSLDIKTLSKGRQDINNEFIQVIDRNHLKMRVWERGSGETLACGTGACAAVVVATIAGYCDKGVDVRVDLLGGRLTINYTDETVYMTGNAIEVFKGEINHENQ